MIHNKNSKSSILVVDDDSDIRESVVAALEDEGYKVSAVEDGSKALEYLNTAAQKPDLILLDLKMPTMDGVTFREEQMKNADFGRIPVVIVTADPDAEEKAVALKAAGFLRKPIDMGIFLDTIERVLGRNGNGGSPTIPLGLTWMICIHPELLRLGFAL